MIVLYSEPILLHIHVSIVSWAPHNMLDIAPRTLYIATRNMLKVVCGYPCQNYGASPAIWDHTLPPDTGECTPP